MATASSPYRIADHPTDKTCLRQGEILSDVLHFRGVFGDQESLDGINYRIDTIPFGVIITQDCDLEQDYHVRFVEPKSTSDKLMPNVLLARVYLAEDIKITSAENSKRKWDNLKIAANMNPRFHFMQGITPETDQLNSGTPELTIDFKNYFTIPTAELYHFVRAGDTKRRCVFISPYLEHLSHRFAFYLSRVGLPENYHSE